MKNFKWDYIVYSGFVIVIGIIFIRSYFRQKVEFKTDYNFEVTDVEITAKKGIILYDGDKKVIFSLFSLRDYEGVKKGDFVVKESYSPYLFIYRKDSLGVKQLYLKVKGYNTWMFHGFDD
ncbi:hypothetical protein [Sphingobacterium sp. DR205]|uniref:hypothetical protein n=1 Tax=Sphingobacterium sp. DR205 TaxID=2713573 RepID=UPI0013E513F1|nr:hypothetical protein [Sphingobacterium sp. DR205]QIH34419.1 hypothetical protein G6053_16680 [Sphingobacterium sp. DR205]